MIGLGRLWKQLSKEKCLRQRKERDRAWETAEQREVCLRQIGKETRNQPASLGKLAPQ